jgi:hypothetical protein
MDAKTRFAALKTACLEQARVDQSDAIYWLNEADEWARLEQAAASPIESPPLQLELLHGDYRWTFLPLPKR